MNLIEIFRDFGILILWYDQSFNAGIYFHKLIVRGVTSYLRLMNIFYRVGVYVIDVKSMEFRIGGTPEFEIEFCYVSDEIFERQSRSRLSTFKQLSHSPDYQFNFIPDMP